MSSVNMNNLIKTLVRIHSYSQPIDYVKPFVNQERNESVGSGTFVDPTVLGLPTQPEILYILTCAHVIDKADQVSVVLPLKGSEKIPATVLAFVPKLNYDLAIIALPNPGGEYNAFISTLPLGDSTQLQPGEKLVALGFPMGQTGLKVSDGVFAGIEHYLQHTVSISPGNSGGPLINTAGELIGINNAGITHAAASNIGYAVPIELYSITAARFFSKTVGPPSGERVLRQPLFGFLLQPTTQAHLAMVAGQDAVGRSGVFMYYIVPGSPAEEAGLQEGDFLGEIEQIPCDFHGEIKVSWSAQKVPIETVLQRLSDPSRAYSFTVYMAKSKEWRMVQLGPKVLHLYASLHRYSPYEPVEYMDIQGFIIMQLVHNHKQYEDTFKSCIELSLPQRFQPHVIITYVVPGSAADVSKTLKAGDLLTAVNGVQVRYLKDVQRSLSHEKNGTLSPTWLTTSKGKSTVI